MAETATQTNTVTITVDDQEYQVPAGMLLIDAITLYTGWRMPRFCHHSRLDPVGMCRMCLAEVEGRGRWAIAATCTMRVADGMNIRVHSETATRAREMTLELLLVNHPLDCPICDKGGECQLQDQTVAHGPEVGRTVEPRRHWVKPIPISADVLLDRERCIQCSVCTRFVDEVAGEKTIELVHRGGRTEVSPAFDGVYDSHFSGNTCDICPVGALTSRSFRFRSRPWEMDSKPAVSPYTACGSNLWLDTRENVIRRAMPRENRAVNDLWLSDKERFDYSFVLDEARLDVPLVRNRDSGELEQATWEDALAAAAEGLANAVREGNGVAGIGSTVVSCEEQYAFQKLVRGILGSNSVCTSKPLDLERRAGLVPTYDELQEGKLFLAAGSPMDELPIAWLRVHKALRKRGARLLTIGNRDEHAALLTSLDLGCEPGREALVVNTLCHWIYSEKRHNSHAIGAHSRGLREAAKGWEAYTLDRAAEAGIDVERLRGLAEELLASDGLVILAGQSDGRPDGTALRDALFNLALLLDVPGMEHGGFIEPLPNCNARGASDMGLRPDLLPGYAAVAEAAERKRFSRVWGLPVPAKAGLDLTGVLQAAEAGKLGALLVMGSDVVADVGNPFQAARNRWLNQSKNGAVAEVFSQDEARRSAALERVPFLVVTELFLTATAKLADVVLPATCFAERPGTYVNLEGRIQYAPAAVRPILGVRRDLAILNDLAAQVAARLEGNPTWPELTAESAWDEIRSLVPSYGEATREALQGGSGVVTELAPAEGKYEFVVGG